MAFDQYETYDALGLVALIAAREVSAREVLEAAIARMEERNPALNVLVDPLYEAARRTVGAGLPDSPLAGVPFLMKGLGLSMTGVRCTQGSRLFDDFIAEHDSTLVARIRRAGLVIFGTVTSPELDHRARRPRPDPQPLEPGVQPRRFKWRLGGGGGRPDRACRERQRRRRFDPHSGVHLRPSRPQGVARAHAPSGPDIGEGWGGLSNEHALTRTVRDSAALLDATHGPAPGDPYFAKPPERPFLDEVGRNPGKLRIALMTAPPDGRSVDEACVREARKAAALCESLGHHVEEAGPAFDIGAAMQALRMVVAGNIRLTVEMRLRDLGRELRQGDIENIPKTWMEEGANASARDFAHAMSALHQVARIFGEFFEDYDVLLTPTLAREPMKLGTQSMDGTDLDAYWALQGEFIAFTAPHNAAGTTAISLPLGMTADGLPVGVQFGAAMGNEAFLLRLASQIEAAVPWADRRPTVT